MCWLIHRNRGQAPSHILISIGPQFPFALMPLFVPTPPCYDSRALFTGNPD
ncbi:hypothetical protein C4J96_4341 [Pseudomonas orientalis]|nr:hypothetical protein C4J96_4341 [Pseudomonas orientalis]